MNKRFIQHGIWRNFGAFNRRTKKPIIMPLKFREFLQKKLMKFHLPQIEFTYGEIPDKHLEAITIVHPLDHFNRKCGHKIINERLNWIEIMADADQYYEIYKRSWAWALGKKLHDDWEEND